MAKSPDTSPDKSSQPDESKQPGSTRSFVREFIVEFNGSLVPGFLFTVVSVTLLACTALLAFMALNSAISSEPISMKDVLIDFDPVRFELLALVLVVSYVIGSVFSREDIKVPDEKSAIRVLREMGKPEADRSAVQYDRSGKLDVQFPYLFLHEYLESRGLGDLAKLVPWQGSVESTHKSRSKMFINRLKIRLQFLLPEKCGTIVRNEAHTRMMASTWYAARGLKWVSVALFTCSVVLMLSEWQFRHTKPHLSEALALSVTCAVVFGFMWWIQVRIERFIHYQRVREIVWVLETVQCAKRLGYSIEDAPAENKA